MSLVLMVGVGITILVRNSNERVTIPIGYNYVPELVDQERNRKANYVSREKDIKRIDWQNIQPDERHTWLTESLRPEFITIFYQ